MGPDKDMYPKLGWNLALYVMPGNDAEWLRAVDMIEVIRKASASSASCMVVMQIMYGHQSARYEVSQGKVSEPEPVRIAGENPVSGACQTDTLTAFIHHAQKMRPGEPIALVIQAHASGLSSIRDCSVKGSDKQPSLTCVAIKRAISDAGGRVDLLGLNACWMAGLEIEYELRDAARVLVASQVYAEPWPHGAIVSSLCKDPQQSAEELALGIVTAVETDIRSSGSSGRKDAVSAFRARVAMQHLADAVNAYAEHITDLIRKEWPKVREAVLIKAQRIDDPYQVDLGSLTQVLGAEHESARRVRALLETRRIGSTAHRMHPGLNGLSIFCPKCIQVNVKNVYEGIEFAGSAWERFLTAFRERLTRDHEQAIAGERQRVASAVIEKTRLASTRSVMSPATHRDGSAG
jgi:hypothetical protein